MLFPYVRGSVCSHEIPDGSVWQWLVFVFKCWGRGVREVGPLQCREPSALATGGVL